jgi:hypothetical protein
MSHTASATSAEVSDLRRRLLRRKPTKSAENASLKRLLDAYLRPDAAGPEVHDDQIVHLPPRPYPGLRSFLRNESEFFFSRDQDVENLIERVSNRQALMVLGGSGTGKSSLLRAGLLPRITGIEPLPGREGAWYAVAARPETVPVTRLADAIWQSVLIRVWRNGRTRPTLFSQLGILAHEIDPDETSAGIAVTARVREWLRPRGRRTAAPEWGLARVQQEIFALELRAAGTGLTAPPNLVVIIDQFEEIFREGIDIEERQELLRIIAAVRADESAKVQLILVMRSEDTHRCAQIPLLAELLNDRPYYVPWLTEKQLRNAIVQPAREVFEDWSVLLGDGQAAPFDRTLVKDLLQEAAALQQVAEASADHLPLLQHGLEAIWDTALRRMDDISEVIVPRFTKADLPGGSLTQCLLLRAGEAKKAAETAYERALTERRQKASTPLINRPRFPGAGLAVRAAFCELTSLDENRRVHRTFCTPRQIAENRFGRDDDVLRAGLLAVLKTFEAHGYLSRGRSGFDVSHEALPRNWQDCEEWLREDARAAEALIDTAAPGAELSRSKATEVGQLLERDFGPYSESWLSAAVAGVLSLQISNREAAQKEARAIVGRARQRFRKYRSRHRLVFWIQVGSAALFLIVLLLGSLLVNAAAREQLVKATWIASQHSGSALQQSVGEEANELAAASRFMEPENFLDRWTLRVAHWQANIPWPIRPALPEENIAWATLDRAERTVFGTTFAVKRDAPPPSGEQARFSCASADGGVVRATNAGSIGGVSVGLETGGEVRFLGADGPVEPLQPIQIQTSGITDFCLSSDGRILVTLSKSSATPNIYTLEWLHLCSSSVNCDPVQSVRLKAIHNESRHNPNDGPATDASIQGRVLDISGSDPTGLRRVWFGSPNTSFVAFFYEGLAEPILEGHETSGLHFEDLHWTGWAGIERAEPIMLPTTDPSRTYSLLPLRFSAASKDGMRSTRHTFRVIRADAEPFFETPLEGWELQSAAIVGVAATGADLFLKDETGGIWRIALHVARRWELYRMAVFASPRSQYTWTDACWNLGCERLLVGP